MDYDISKLEEYGVDTEVGLEYTGGYNKYISALQRFYKSYESNRAKLDETLSSGNITDFTIYVHALKSNARMIGAVELSSMFEELELAGRDGNSEAITKAAPDTIERYKRLIEQLRPIGEAKKVTAADEISAEEARETAGKLLEALDDFDDELSLKLATKLKGYPFRITQRDMLEQAVNNIEDFLYDEAAEIIRDISETIE